MRVLLRSFPQAFYRMQFTPAVTRRTTLHAHVSTRPCLINTRPCLLPRNRKPALKSFRLCFASKQKTCAQLGLSTLRLETKSLHSTRFVHVSPQNRKPALNSFHLCFASKQKACTQLVLSVLRPETKSLLFIPFRPCYAPKPNNLPCPSFLSL